MVTSKLVNDAYETLRPYVPGKPVSETERELGVTGCVKLASNENPLGPSPRALAAMREALTSLHEYPDGGAFYMKQALARYHNLPVEQLIVGNGTNEIIEMLIRTCVRPGEHMLYATSSFVIYKLCAHSAGCEIREVPLRELRFDLPALAKAVTPQTKLLFIANPNNPTGTYVTRAELETFLDAVPEHVLVVLDEAYFEYATAPDYPNGLDYLKRRERLMVLRTFSKCYGLAGIRIGYGIGNATLVEYLNRGRQPFNVNSLAQVAARAALTDSEHLQRSVQLNREQMLRLVPELRRRGLGVTDSQANFVLVDFHESAEDVFQRLLRQAVIIRPLPGYHLPTCARVTVGTEEQNDKLLRALDAVLR